MHTHEDVLSFLVEAQKFIKQGEDVWREPTTVTPTQRPHPVASAPPERKNAVLQAIEQLLVHHHEEVRKYAEEHICRQISEMIYTEVGMRELFARFCECVSYTDGKIAEPRICARPAAELVEEKLAQFRREFANPPSTENRKEFADFFANKHLTLVKNFGELMVMLESKMHEFQAASNEQAGNLSHYMETASGLADSLESEIRKTLQKIQDSVADVYERSCKIAELEDTFSRRIDRAIEEKQRFDQEAADKREEIMQVPGTLSTLPGFLLEICRFNKEARDRSAFMEQQIIDIKDERQTIIDEHRAALTVAQHKLKDYEGCQALLNIISNASESILHVYCKEVEERTCGLKRLLQDYRDVYQDQFLQHRRTLTDKLTLRKSLVEKNKEELVKVSESTAVLEESVRRYGDIGGSEDKLKTFDAKYVGLQDSIRTNTEESIALRNTLENFANHRRELFIILGFDPDADVLPPIDPQDSGSSTGEVEEFFEEHNELVIEVVD